MTIDRSNLIKRENGIITYTVEITWLSGMSTGWGNGYVAVPKGHKLFGIGYDDINIDAHGGLTYSSIENIEGVEYWVIGFDCAHAWDNPQTSDEAFVIAETERLYQSVINY